MPYKNQDAQRAYKRDWARMQRAGERSPRVAASLPPEFRMRTAVDILVLLSEQVSAVRDDPEIGVIERARCIAYLAGVALRAVETVEVASRLEALERVLSKEPK